MSKTLRLSDMFLEDAKRFLIEKGFATESTSWTTVVVKCISLALSGTPSLSDARELTGHEDPVAPRLAGMASRFMQATDGMTTIHNSPLISPELNEELAESARNLRQKGFEIKDCVVHLPGDEQLLAKPAKLSDIPPWEDMPLFELEEIEKYYPKHPGLEWAAQDELKQLALRAAFASAPKAVHKSMVVISLADNIYQAFLYWKEQKNNDKL